MNLEDSQASSARAGFAAILERFPGHSVILHQFFQESSSFQSLCADYWDCLVAWQNWRQDSSKEAPAVSQSYAELLQELEEDVRQYLELVET